MNRPVILDPRAERELEDAAVWYEQQAGLGMAFVQEVQDVLTRIGLMPELHALVYGNLRRTRVRRYPYSVFYRVLDDRVEVVAVFHDHRDPKGWQSRV